MDVVILVTETGGATSEAEQGSHAGRTLPRAIIPAADSALRLNGALTSHFADLPLTYSDVPMMTDAEWKVYLDKAFQGRKWKRWRGKTPTLLISIIVITDEPVAELSSVGGGMAGLAPIGADLSPIGSGLSSIGDESATDDMAVGAPSYVPAPPAGGEARMPAPIPASGAPVMDFLKPDVTPPLSRGEKATYKMIMRIVGVVAGVLLVAGAIWAAVYISHRMAAMPQENYDKALARASKAEEVDAAFRDLPPNTQYAEIGPDRRSANSAQLMREKAIGDLTEAIRLKPDFADAYLARAELYDIMGMKVKAEPDHAKYKSLGGTKEAGPVGIAAKAVADKQADEAAQEAADREAALQALRTGN